MSGSTFFDIDDILAEADTVPIIVETECYNMDTIQSGAIRFASEEDMMGLSELDQSNSKLDEEFTPEELRLRQFKQTHGIHDAQSQMVNSLGKRNNLSKIHDLSRGSKIKIPFWLAHMLEIEDIVTIEVPQLYSDSFRKIIMAEPAVVNLGEKSRYFYEVGMKICKVLRERKSNLRDTLKFVGEAYMNRAKTLINLILHLQDDKDSAFLNYLTDCEEVLFNSCREYIVQQGSAVGLRKVDHKNKALGGNRKQLKPN